ncbi:Nn.00g068470.m01.CDS01 [Neocucurbitaria sp. VM-36]
MHILSFLCPALLAASGAEALRSGSKVKLSSVQSLTLRKGLSTSHRRVEAIPQLKCIGGSARGLYDVDVMRCKNSGSDYDENSIQWTCTASLPEEFKLGSTDVICEGYDSPDDPYILKGSCGVEYRLVLTEKGREKYGKDKGGGWWGGDDEGGEGREGPKTMGERVAAAVFWLVFIGVALWMVYSAFVGWAQRPAGGVGGGNRPGWGGGGGGWGGGNNDPYDDPPPPYYPSNSNKPQSGYGATEGWRPGFWSGAMGGAAAGWAAGRMGNRGNQTGSGWGTGNGSGSGWNNGEGSSRSSSGSSFSSTRHESTGFGSTSRR